MRGKVPSQPSFMSLMNVRRSKFHYGLEGRGGEVHCVR